MKTVAVIGAGVIGAGWAARCLGRGYRVKAWDPAEAAERGLRESVANAWPAVERLGTDAGASTENLEFCGTLEQACDGADFVQEAAPERIELKRKLHAQMDAATPVESVIASSTSGLLPSEFQADCRHPERILVGHPFNPVYLLPLVEICGGERTSGESISRAGNFYRALGMYPLHVRNEVPGFLADRLQEAMWREALHLVNDGVATTEELDASIAYGPGLRWAIWGSCQIFNLAGGEGGIRHMLEHFDPSLFPWTKLEAPEITPDLLDRMEQGTRAQSGGRSIKQLEQIRDDCLIEIMEALQKYDVGAGSVIAEHRRRLGS